MQRRALENGCNSTIKQLEVQFESGDSYQKPRVYFSIAQPGVVYYFHWTTTTTGLDHWAGLDWTGLDWTTGPLDHWT